MSSETPIDSDDRYLQAMIIIKDELALHYNNNYHNLSEEKRERDAEQMERVVLAEIDKVINFAKRPVIAQPDKWLQLIKDKLFELGMSAAANDCNKQNLSEYAKFYARFLLMKAGGYVPLMCISECLSQKDELSLFQAVVIYYHYPRCQRPSTSGDYTFG